MKRGAFLLLFLTMLFGSLTFLSVPVNASTEDFYFSDFTADYYLSRGEDGVSHLRVVEQLTTEFPNFEQNKGIIRQIPITTQGGTNIVLRNLDESNISVLRNGVPEPIWSIGRDGDHFSVETGTDDYVLGTQIYTLSYEFEKVITDFGSHQDLYWDTNGNGWLQRFDRVTARLHFDDPVIMEAWSGGKWCYVGALGENRENACTISEIDDGVEFAATNLSAYENLSFDVNFEPETFVVPETEKSYVGFIVVGIVALICIVLVIRAATKYRKTSELIKEYNGIFTAPQYQPVTDYSLAEMTEIYLGKKKDAKVGILLDLIVRKKVEIRKKDRAGLFSDKWELIIKDSSGLRREEEIILQILNGGNEIKNGDIIEIKNYSSTPMLTSLGKSFDDKILADIKNDGLVKNGYKLGSAGALSLTRGIFSNLFLAYCLTFFLGAMVLTGFDMVEDWQLGEGKILTNAMECSLASVLLVFITSFIALFLSSRKTIIGKHTQLGLKMSKYMEGLKLYIGMAEADRLKMLQSVEGVDTSAEGIVKLYEKLLPYAAVFGLEESWMKEMEQYCKVQEIEQPNYLLAGITASDLSHSMRSAAGSVGSSSGTIAGGGSYSSSSSGSGGGGFSGGGGGGGGGGGR